MYIAGVRCKRFFYALLHYLQFFGGIMAAQKKKTPVGKIILFVCEILVLIAMIGVLWFVLRATDEDTGVDRITIKEEEIRVEMNKQVQENEVMKGYRNIALFGVDSRGGQLKTGTRSDSIMIASINLDTKDVKLVSVYRDTYLNTMGANQKYDKCNSAYSYGGAERAIKMLNSNLDMDITDFITIGFEGLRDVVDALGGVYIEVDDSEIAHLNNYQRMMVEEVAGIDSYVPVVQTGYQLLDGLQATAYCRIRYTAGSDFKRTERQREVFKACLDTAKTASPATLVKICNNVFSEVYTSLDLTEIIDLLGGITQYDIVADDGFPQMNDIKLNPGSGFGPAGDCIMPFGLENSVSWLHKFLFDENNYEASEEVKEYNQKIVDFATPYLQ